MRTIRKLFRLAVLAGTAGLLLTLAVNGIVIAAAKRHIVPPQETQGRYDCILVLGCQVYGDTPSAMLRDRLDRAVALYRAGVSERLLMSGDHGRETYDEVNVMKLYAVQQGVPADAVLMDHAGFSTYESMYRARDIFEADRVLIVTQPYHLYRAVYDARLLGLDADGTSAVERPLVFPLYNTAREILARSKDFVFTIVRPKPTFLGDPIPITSPGSLTDDRLYV